MPLPVPPTRFDCPQCGWHQITFPTGDVLLAGHTWFACCPHCGCDHLISRPATRIEQLLSRLGQTRR